MSFTREVTAENLRLLDRIYRQSRHHPIEILWRFIKYEWLEVSAYRNWKSLVESVEGILRGFGEKYVINFG